MTKLARNYVLRFSNFATLVSRLSLKKAAEVMKGLYQDPLDPLEVVHRLGMEKGIIEKMMVSDFSRVVTSIAPLPSFQGKVGELQRYARSISGVSKQLAAYIAGNWGRDFVDYALSAFPELVASNTAGLGSADYISYRGKKFLVFFGEFTIPSVRYRVAGVHLMTEIDSVEGETLHFCVGIKGGEAKRELSNAIRTKWGQGLVTFRQ